MNAPRIVRFRPELAPHFKQLNVEWLQKYFEVEPIDEFVLSDPAKTVIADGGDILFARDGGEIVGTVALKHHGEGLYELTKMAVTEASQGRGIGQLLLAACIDRYAELGGKGLYLESHSSLAPALALYERAGFRHTPRPEPSEYARADVYMVYEGA